jgi:hypothetical protein
MEPSTGVISPPIHDDAPPPPPDWLAVDRELLCPLCDYNLRGLTESRCPECGHQFNWRELQEEKRREHPYLFEHQHRRNVWSFFQTRKASLRSRRFWREVQPLHRPDPRRLIMYWLAAVMLCMLIAPLMLITPLLQDYFFRVSTTGPFTFIAPGFGLRQVHFWMHDIGGPIILMIIAWPWLTFGALLLYRASLRQAKILPSHVLRCAVYTADAASVVVPLLILAAVLRNRELLGLGELEWLYHPFGYRADPSLLVPLLLALCVLAYRLSIAYRRYLRFRHSIVAVVASQLIVGLVIFKAYFYWRVGY